VREIDDGVWLLRLDDDRTEFFEAAWRIPEGITYNSYLLRAPDGFVLIDTWKGAYSEQFIDALREVVNPRRVSYPALKGEASCFTAPPCPWPRATGRGRSSTGAAGGSHPALLRMLRDAL